MRILPFLFLVVASMAAGAAPAADSPEGPITAQLQVPAGNLHDRCMPLAAGQAVEVDFSAAPPLDFSVQLEGSPERHYALARNNARALKRVFRAPQAGSFCFEWKNTRQSNSSLTYRLTVNAPGAPPAGSPPAPPR